jgi:hypothetical protein
MINSFFLETFAVVFGILFRQNPRPGTQGKAQGSLLLKFRGFRRKHLLVELSQGNPFQAPL